MHLDDIGFQLAIDFVNTVSWRTSESPEEWLQSADGVLRWLQDHGAITPAERTALEGNLPAGSSAAIDWRNRAVALREAGRELLLAEGNVARNLRALNAHLAGVVPTVERGLERFHLAWAGPTGPGDALWPVAYSFGQILTSEMLGRVRECEGEGCGWLFLDESKNRSRKWCDMSDCGNRAKARRHYKKISTDRQKRGARS